MIPSAVGAKVMTKRAGFTHPPIHCPPRAKLAVPVEPSRPSARPSGHMQWLLSQRGIPEMSKPKSEPGCPRESARTHVPERIHRLTDRCSYVSGPNGSHTAAAWFASNHLPHLSPQSARWLACEKTGSRIPSVRCECDAEHLGELRPRHLLNQMGESQIFSKPHLTVIQTRPLLVMR